MSIQWYPGHMHKASQEIARVLPRVDAVIELRDARIPYSSENPMLRALADRHPTLTLLTRDDLADPEVTRLWLADFASRDETAVATCLTENVSLPDLADRLSRLIARRATPERPALALIAGIPNVGKSTLVNRLAERSIARTGNEPAVTRRQQQIRLDNHWRLLDTPGVLWPRVDNAASGFRLAATGAIRDTAHDAAEVAAVLLEQLVARGYGDRLVERYAIVTDGDGVERLEAIGRRQGCLAAGGHVDFDRAARRVLTDFRQGRLGRVTLETPTQRLDEEARVATELTERAARRERRRAARSSRRRGH